MREATHGHFDIVVDCPRLLFPGLPKSKIKIGDSKSFFSGVEFSDAPLAQYYFSPPNNPTTLSSRYYVLYQLGFQSLDEE